MPPRILLPFLFLIIVSFLTPKNRSDALDRYYAKMKTEVDPDPEVDRANLEQSYQNPTRFDDRKIFPGSDIEILRPRWKDMGGFRAAVAACFVILGALVWVARIGA